MADKPKPTYAVALRGSTVVLNKDPYEVATELWQVFNRATSPGEIFAAMCDVLGIEDDARTHAINAEAGGCNDPGPGRLFGSCRRCTAAMLEADLGK